MCPSINVGQLDDSRQPAAHGFPQCHQPARVEFASAANVTPKMTCGEKVAHGRLLKHGSMSIRQEASGRELVDQLRRNDQVTEAEARQEDVAETPGVNDRTALIEALERRNRATGVAILAVVVVLENPCSCAIGPFEKRHSPAHGHHWAQRKLMGRCDVDEFRTAASAL